MAGGKNKGKKSKKNSNDISESVHSEDEIKGLSYVKTRRQKNEPKKVEKKETNPLLSKNSELLLKKSDDEDNSAKGAFGEDNGDYEDDPFNIPESVQKRASVKRPIMSSSSSVSSIETVNINKSFLEEDKEEVIIFFLKRLFYFFEIFFIVFKLINEKKLQIVEKIIAENMELNDKLNSANRKLASNYSEPIKATEGEIAALIERLVL
jgi:hypothetical protein